MENTDVLSGLHDFLERMRQPSAADFVKSIKSFIVSFSNHAPNPERDSAAVQEFLANMEAAFRAHPLWAGCSEEELESAGEVLDAFSSVLRFLILLEDAAVKQRANVLDINSNKQC